MKAPIPMTGRLGPVAIFTPILLFAISAFVAGVVATTVRASTKLGIVVSNSSFEDADPANKTKPFGWAAVPNTSGGGTFTWIKGTAGAEVHSGGRAIMIGDPKVGSGQARWQQASTAPSFEVQPGNSFLLSFWAKGTKLDLEHDQVRLAIEWMSSTGLIRAWNSPPQSFSKNDTWQQFSITSGPAPANAIAAKILIYFQRDAESASFQPAVTFDDITITVP